MPQIQGATDEAVALYREPLTTKEMGYSTAFPEGKQKTGNTLSQGLHTRWFPGYGSKI